VCDEFFAHFGWACSHAVQTVVAHIKGLLFPIVQSYQKRHRGASIRQQASLPAANRGVARRRARRQARFRAS
jgi:hypothetical protein